MSSTESTNPEALLALLLQVIGSLEEMRSHSKYMDGELLNEIDVTISDTRLRLGRKHINVCIVGEQKAGKSTFLNALLGHSLLGSAVRECTGTVTFIKSGNRIDYHAIKSNGQAEKFGDIHENRQDEFGAKLHSLKSNLQLLRNQLQSLPGEIAERINVLNELNISLEKQKKLTDAIAMLFEEADAVHKKARLAIADFRTKLDATEGSVPWAYRRTGRQLDVARRGVRGVMNFWIKPEWEQHYSEVKKWEAMLNNANGLESKANELRDSLRSASLKKDELARELSREEENQRNANESLAVLPRTIEVCEKELADTEANWKNYYFECLEAFKERIKLLTDMDRLGADVQEIHLMLWSPRLPAGIVLVDTPGVNTATELNRERAWRVIREQADACILLVDISQTLSESTRQFVRDIKAIVPHIYLVLTKIDSAIRNAEMAGDDATSQIEEAKRTGAMRFAAEVGRAENEILAFAVSAKPALSRPHSEEALQFQREVSRLFEVVVNERLFAATSRCTVALTKLLAATKATAPRVVDGYQKRIGAMTQQQIQSPVDFSRTSIQNLDKEIRALAADVSTCSRDRIRGDLSSYRTRTLASLESAANDSALLAALKTFSDHVDAELSAIADHCMRHVESIHGARIRQLVDQCRRPLLERYRIIEKLGAPPRRELPIRAFSASECSSIRNISKEAQKKVQGLVNSRWRSTLSAGRAGAAVARNPNAASLLVAGLSLANAARVASKFPAIKKECIKEIDQQLGEVYHRATSEATAGPFAVQQHIEQNLARISMEDVSAFQVWIDSIINQEHRELEKEQHSLAEFVALRERLSQQETMLGHLVNEAANHCFGASRITSTQDKSQEYERI